MQISIVTMGSRGDVEPFLALARGLLSAGHDVVVGGPPNLAPLAASRDIPYSAVGLDSEAFHRDPAAAKVIESGGIGAALRGATMRRLQERMARIATDAWHLAQGSDLLIHKAGFSAGEVISEALGVPRVAVALSPMTPTRAFPPPLAGDLPDFGAWSNLALGRAFEGVVAWMGWPAVRTLRRSLRSSRAPKRTVPTFAAFSPLVVPRPDDWPSHVTIGGYLCAQERESWTPPPALEAFLERGELPIAVGFGSMTHLDPRRLREIVERAVTAVGTRAIILGGWGGIATDGTVSDRVLALSAVPHGWLFPRVRAVVHHGGAGTTAAALRSGAPSIVVPHNFDQPFWARRVHALGVGSRPLPFSAFDEASLASRLQEILDDDVMRQRAGVLARRLAREDGVAALVNEIEQHARTGAGRSGPRRFA